MDLKIIKRLLIWLSVAALVGGPWAQAFAQSAFQHNAVSPATAAATTPTSDALACDTATHQKCPSKSTSADCTQNCLAPLNFALPTFSLHFEHLAPIFALEIPVIMDGRTPEPELSPPIALV